MSSNDDRPHRERLVAATFSRGATAGFKTPPPGRPKRDLAVLEELTETIATKLAFVEQSVDRLEESCATKEQVQQVYLEARQARRLLVQHIEHTREEAKAAARRDEAIMTMLGDIIGRLPPAPSTTSSPPPTASLEAPPAPDSSSKSK